MIRSTGAKGPLRLAATSISTHPMSGPREAIGAMPVGVVNSGTKVVRATPVRSVSRGSSRKWKTDMGAYMLA